MPPLPHGPQRGTQRGGRAAEQGGVRLSGPPGVLRRRQLSREQVGVTTATAAAVVAANAAAGSSGTTACGVTDVGVSGSGSGGGVLVCWCV